MGILGNFLRNKGVKGSSKSQRKNRSGKQGKTNNKIKNVIVVDEQDEVDFTSSATFDTDSLSADSIVDDDESIQSTEVNSNGQQVKKRRSPNKKEDEQVVVLEGALPLSMLDVISPGWNTLQTSHSRSDPPKPAMPNPRQRYQLAFKGNWKYATECEITEWKWEKQIVRDRRKTIEHKRNEDRAKRLKARATETTFERDFLPYDNVHSRKMLHSAFPENEEQEEDLSEFEECIQTDR